MMDPKERIARRVARELQKGDLVNLGIGLPSMVVDFIPEGLDIMLQSENGIIGLGPVIEEDGVDKEITNAGGSPVSIVSGGCFFDSALSFGIIRGGHVDVTVLGALQVDEKGGLANWMVPGKLVAGMGGAMDLVTGAKRVIVSMQHTVKGKPKILKKCTLPLTAAGEVDTIITEMAVMDVTKRGLKVKEISPVVTVKELREATEADLIIEEPVKTMME